MRCVAPLAFVVALGCSSPQDAPPKEKKDVPAAPAPKPEAKPPVAMKDEPVLLSGDGGPLERDLLKSFATLAAKDLKASERFASDVLDVRAIQDRSDESVPSGELEEMLRREIAHEGLHTLARPDPREPERAKVALPVYGFVDGVRDGESVWLFFHVETASEAPGASARVVWAFDARARVKASKPTSVKAPFKLDLHALATDAANALAKLVKDEPCFEVQQPVDKTGRFPVQAFDAALRTRFVRRGLPLAWRRAAGIDAPPALASPRPPEKRLDLPRIRGEVEELKEGGAILVLRVERWTQANRWEITGSFDRKLD
jgi:hypothetical protein